MLYVRIIVKVEGVVSGMVVITDWVIRKRFLEMISLKLMFFRFRLEVRKYIQMIRKKNCIQRKQMVLDFEVGKSLICLQMKKVSKLFGV